VGELLFKNRKIKFVVARFFLVDMHFNYYFNEE